MRLIAKATVLGFVLMLASAQYVAATPLLTTDVTKFADATLIDFEDLTTLAITNQYADDGVIFSSGLHAELGFPALVPGGTWGVIAASNSECPACPEITMNFTAPMRGVGFELVTLDAAVTQFELFTSVGGVSTPLGTLAFDSGLEIKFVGILANPTDPSPLLDSLIIRPLLPPAPGTAAAFAIDNVRLDAVPEPATLTLLGIGISGLAARARRRRR